MCYMLSMARGDAAPAATSQVCAEP
ncbi:hypothetical protein PCAR4_450104 [Paraburkholderia caribensis]|nr:hypothetical protein PCAR4_450104 [Paraburkholderia caribensis]